MKTNLVLLALFAFHFNAEGSPGSTPPTIVYEQLPSNRVSGGSRSDGGVTSADDFRLGGPIAVTSLTWWGNDYIPQVADVFSIRFFEDDNGKPGALLSEFEPTLVTKAIEGFGSQPLGGYELSRYSAPLPSPQAFQAEVRYWLSIKNPRSAEWTWDWRISDSHANPGMLFKLEGEDWGNLSYGTETSFQLFGVPEPSSLLLLVAGCAGLERRRRQQRKLTENLR